MSTLNEIVDHAWDIVTTHALTLLAIEAGTSADRPYVLVRTSYDDFRRAFSGRPVLQTSTGYAIDLGEIRFICWTERPTADVTVTL